jgi:pimeloyl-ACP methyl ester carboxylesterase
VILLHGFPEHWYGWRRQIGPLADAGFRVLAPDGRGYNRSDKPTGVGAYGLDTLVADVLGLADALGRERVSLVGHDWGGIVAWWAATRHPDRIERLAVLNAPHPAVARSYLLRHPGQIGAELVRRLLPDSPPARSAAARRRPRRAPAFAHGHEPSGHVRRSGPGKVRRGLVRARRAHRDGELVSRPAPLPGRRIGAGFGAHAPALGRPRSVSPVRPRGAELGALRPGTPRRFDEATHWVHLEEAEAVNDALIGFLR